MFYSVVGQDDRGEKMRTMEREGTAHIISACLDELSVPVQPGKDSICGSSVIPWPEPLFLEPGDRVKVSLAANWWEKVISGAGISESWTRARRNG